MSHYVVRRLASLMVVLWGVSILSFALGSLAPGDPAEIRLVRELGRPPTGEELEAKREEMGLHRPVAAQYVDWLGGALQGELGRSWGNGEEVARLLAERFLRTAVLAVTALGVAICLALPLGTWAAYRRNSVVDHTSRVTALVGASFPSYFTGYLLMFIFGVKLGVLPVFGFDTPRHLVLPAVTLAFGAAALLARLTRSTLLEVLGEDYVRLAVAKGVRRRRILVRHGLRNALIPILTVIGLSLGHLLAGAVIVEWIFAWPGLGKLAVDAIHARDLPLVQGFVLFAGTVFVLVNLVTDLAYTWVDPRVRLQAREE